jgi:hypothetical protein
MVCEIIFKTNAGGAKPEQVAGDGSNCCTDTGLCHFFPPHFRCFFLYTVARSELENYADCAREQRGYRRSIMYICPPVYSPSRPLHLVWDLTVPREREQGDNLEELSPHRGVESSSYSVPIATRRRVATELSQGDGGRGLLHLDPRRRRRCLSPCTCFQSQGRCVAHLVFFSSSRR